VVTGKNQTKSNIARATPGGKRKEARPTNQARRQNQTARKNDEYQYKEKTTRDDTTARKNGGQAGTKERCWNACYMRKKA